MNSKITFFVASLMLAGAMDCDITQCKTCMNKECVECDFPFREKISQDKLRCNACPGQFCRTCSEDLKCIDYDVCPNPMELTNIDGTACFPCDVPLCQHCFSENFCQQCIEGAHYNRANGTCYECAEGCADCDPANTTLCKMCTDPKKKPSTDMTKCVECDIEGCSNCNSNGVCAQCTDKTKRPNTHGHKCVECDLAFCNKCDLPNVCAQYKSCDKPTEKTNVAGSKCFDCQIDKCLRCSDNGKCESCFIGLSPSEDQKSCLKCLDDCKTCSKQGVCSVCKEQGFKPNVHKNACIKCEAKFCKTCLSQNQCIEYLQCPVEGQKTNITGSECFECKIEGCNFCSKAGVCQKCATGMKPNSQGDKCVKCDIQNCLECSEDNKCYTCRGSMEPSQQGTVCVTCPSDCQVCDNSGKCLKYGEKIKKNKYEEIVKEAEKPKQKPKEEEKKEEKKKYSEEQEKTKVSEKDSYETKKSEKSADTNDYVWCPSNCDKCDDKGWCKQCKSGWHTNAWGGCSKRYWN